MVLILENKSGFAGFVVRNWIVLAVIVVVALFSIGEYNSMNAGRVNVDSKYAQVDNEFQRRAELIPKLVNIVKGYSKHEDKVLTAVTQARAGAVSAKTPGEIDAANAQLSSAFNLVVESYPNLKANEQFTALFRENTGSDNRITTAKRDYNNAVASYNLKLTSFPANIFAGIFNFQQRELFKADADAKANPKVEF